jgi:hypothetical protein
MRATAGWYTAAAPSAAILLRGATTPLQRRRRFHELSGFDNEPVNVILIYGHGTQVITQTGKRRQRTLIVPQTKPVSLAR